MLSSAGLPVRSIDATGSTLATVRPELEVFDLRRREIQIDPFAVSHWVRRENLTAPVSSKVLVFAELPMLTSQHT
jgi:hypothetical protein